MIRLLYNTLIIITCPIWLVWMIARAKKRRQQPNWAERWGNYLIPQAGITPRIWIHAVSVGEVIAARSLTRALRQHNPHQEIIITCTTSTGNQLAQNLKKHGLADYVFYFPIDLPIACKRAVFAVRPSLVAICETELWLNFTHAAKMVGAKTCLVNGRISEKSFARARFLSFFYRALLKNIDLCLMQTHADAERIRSLGATNVAVVGNTKFDDAAESLSQYIDWKRELQIEEQQPLIVVGSTRSPNEDEFVLSALKATSARIIYAPRHIERAPDILSHAKSIGFDAGLRSAGENTRRLLILDTLGELASTYACADLAIIGGGFDNLGGQNIIQPLAAGCPTICGPHMHNFKDVFDQAQAVGAILVASTPEQLKENIRRVLSSQELRETMSKNGRDLVADNTGASSKIAEAINELLNEAATTNPVSEHSETLRPENQAESSKSRT